MADRTLRVKIGIDTSGLKADAAEAARSFDGIGKAATKSADEAEKSTRKVGDETAKSADKSGAAWAKVGPWMGAAAAGGAVLAGKAILDLGMTYEQTQVCLHRIADRGLRRTGRSFNIWGTAGQAVKLELQER